MRPPAQEAWLRSSFSQRNFFIGQLPTGCPPPFSGQLKTLTLDRLKSVYSTDVIKTVADKVADAWRWKSLKYFRGRNATNVDSWVDEGAGGYCPDETLISKRTVPGGKLFLSPTGGSTVLCTMQCILGVPLVNFYPSFYCTVQRRAKPRVIVARTADIEVNAMPKHSRPWSVVWQLNYPVIIKQ